MFPPKDMIRGYCTWLPPMMDCLLRTQGPVLELGGGLGTAIIRAYCADYRRLTTVEANDDWRKWLMKEYPANPFHSIVATMPESGTWEVALVDSIGPLRQPHIVALRGRCKYVVVHDTEDGNFQGYGYDFSGWSHVAIWNDLLPHTAVLTA